MSYLSFQHLDSLLAYLKACAERTTALGRHGERARYSKVFLSVGQEVPTYQIPLDDSADGSDAELYEGKMVPLKAASGNEESVNDLLCRLPLRVFPNEIRHIPSLVVAAPMSEYHTPEEARERLYEAWRGIERVAEGRSRFYFARDEARQISWAVVHIEGVDPQFKVEEWLKKNPSPKLLLLVPPDNGNDAPYLFVQWGYRYPRILDFALLYEARSADHYLLLATAGKPVDLKLLKGNDPTDSWYESHWYDLTIEDVVRDHELCDIIYDERRNHIMTVKPIADTINVPLLLGDSQKVLGAIPDLTRQIHRLEHQLAVLNVKRRRLGITVTHREYNPVYLFEEDPEKPGMPLDMTRFLGRALSELANFRYAAWVADGVKVHCVIGEIPVSLGTVISVPCTHAFIQYTRWAEWGLPLFLQTGCALNIDLEEQVMAERVREMLEKAGIQGAAAVLASPAGEASDPQKLSLTVVPESSPVDQCLAYINGNSGASPFLVAEAVSTHLVPVRQLEVDVSEEVRNVLAELKEVCKDLLGEGEKYWEEIRGKTRLLGMMAETGDQAIRVTRDAYASFPSQWKDFLETILQIDASLAGAKMEAWAQFTLDEETRAKRLEDIRQSYMNAVEALLASERQYQELLDSLLSTQGEVEKAIARLQELKENVTSAQEDLKSTRNDLEWETQRVRRNESDLKAKLLEVAQQQKALEKVWNEVVAARTLLLENEDKLSANKAQYEDDKLKLEEAREKQSEGSKKLDEDRKQLMADRQKLLKDREQYVRDEKVFKKEYEQFAGEAQKFKTYQIKLNAFQKKLQSESQKLLRDQDAETARSKELEAFEIVIKNAKKAQPHGAPGLLSRIARSFKTALGRDPSDKGS